MKLGTSFLLIVVVAASGALIRSTSELSAYDLRQPLRGTAQELLDRAIQSSQKVYTDLPSFVCRETIVRYRSDSRHTEGRRIDTITSLISYAGETEQYSEIYQNTKPRHQIAGMRGAWSQGEYGSFLRETQQAMQNGAVQGMSTSTLNEQPVVVYLLGFNEANSPWDIEVEGRRYKLPFRGQIWVAPDTGAVLRIDRIATSVASETGIAGVTWAVNFGSVPVGADRFHLPTDGVYSVTYTDSDQHEWNSIRFSDYRRFQSSVNVKFQ